MVGENMNDNEPSLFETLGLDPEMVAALDQVIPLYREGYNATLTAVDEAYHFSNDDPAAGVAAALAGAVGIFETCGHTFRTLPEDIQLGLTKVFYLFGVGTMETLDLIHERESRA